MLLLSLLLACPAPEVTAPPVQDTGEAPPPGEICNDGVDNNNNGLVDCEDPRCYKGPCLENCTDGVDNDGDSVVDCDDPDCFWGSWSNRPAEEWEICWAECGTQDASWPHIQNPLWTVCEGTPSMEHCYDGQDNDWDHLPDARDPDCEGLPRFENCYDYQDNDQDGLVDCEDGDCAEQCQEVCDDGRDNDNNFVADCDDLACVGFWGCQELTLEAGELLGGEQSLYEHGAYNSSSFFGYRDSAAWTLEGATGTLSAGPIQCTFADQRVSWSMDGPLLRDAVLHTKIQLSPDCPMPSAYWLAPSVQAEGLSEIGTFQRSEFGKQWVRMLRGPGTVIPGPAGGWFVFPPAALDSD